MKALSTSLIAFVGIQTKSQFMKVILCTGSPQSGHEQVFELLVQAGVVVAKPADQGGLSPEKLQAQLLDSLEVDLNDSTSLDQVTPGKIWGQLAAGLFLANVGQRLWGWTSHQTAVLLDYWQNFDTQTRFVLVYSSPQEYLAQVLDPSQPPEPQAVESALVQWTKWNTALLRYYCRNPNQSILVNSQQAVENPESLLDALNVRWQLTGLSEVAPAVAPAYKHLQLHLVNTLIDTQHHVRSLLQEIDGVAQLPSAVVAEQAGEGARASVWSDWINMCSQLAERLPAAQVAAEVAAHEQERRLLELQLNEVQKELEQYYLRCQELQQHIKERAIGVDFWRMYQPTELCFDMRKDVEGTNWYHAEVDGRWAGPELLSSVVIPPLQTGHYTVSLDVVDAMRREMIETMLLEAFGQSVSFQIDSNSNAAEYPVTCKAQLYVPAVAQPSPWAISLRFTAVETPATGDDRRQLAIRLQALRIRKKS